MKETDEIEIREVDRYQLTEELSVVYEGDSDEIPVHPPDLSVRGMFIHTTRILPVGSVLKVRFRLRRTNFRVNVRVEVRHSVPNVGVGVEFLDLPPDAVHAIEKEISF